MIRETNGYSGFSGVEFTYPRNRLITSGAMHHSTLCLYYSYLRSKLKDGRRIDMDVVFIRSLTSRLLMNR
jgi:hypothetical protein